MEAEDFDRSLGAFQRRKPFRSFMIELVSGDRIEVDHPEAMVIRAGVGVYLSADGAPTLFDHEGVSQVIGDASQSG